MGVRYDQKETEDLRHELDESCFYKLDPVVRKAHKGRTCGECLYCRASSLLASQGAEIENLVDTCFHLHTDPFLLSHEQIVVQATALSEAREIIEGYAEEHGDRDAKVWLTAHPSETS